MLPLEAVLYVRLTEISLGPVAASREAVLEYLVIGKGNAKDPGIR